MVLVDENVEIIGPLGHDILQFLKIRRTSFPGLFHDSLEEDDILPNGTLQHVDLSQFPDERRSHFQTLT